MMAYQAQRITNTSEHRDLSFTHVGLFEMGLLHVYPHF